MAEVHAYRRSVKANATVGEAQQLANNASVPAYIAARFSLWMSFLAMLIAAIALAVAIAT
jgi:hypothetical protein